MELEGLGFIGCEAIDAFLGEELGPSNRPMAFHLAASPPAVDQGRKRASNSCFRLESDQPG